MEAALEALRSQILGAAASRTPLRIRAGGSKDFYGNAPRGQVLDPSGLRGVLAYEPTELVVVARCGTPLVELESLLEREGQMLAFEPPHFGPGATVGGCVAAGLAGPRRASYGYTCGGVRDFVLGAKLLDGSGKLLGFGGQVMKNVAGYDVSRLLCGSLGALGLIVEVSLKVVPRPQAECTLRLEMPESQALDCLNDWGRQPLPVSASAWQAGRLHVRLAGAAPAVEVAAARIGGAALAPDDAAAWWCSIREHSAAFFAGAAPLWRLSLPAGAPPLGNGTRQRRDTPQLIEWGGAQRWLRTTEPAATMRALARSLGGHATLFRCADPARAAFTPPEPAIAALHERLRRVFDPAGVFDFGRLLAAAQP
jgi:glycolate oxidase FAD binding subunit